MPWQLPHTIPAAERTQSIETIIIIFQLVVLVALGRITYQLNEGNNALQIKAK